MDKMLVNYLKNKGYNVCPEDNALANMQIWKQWYKGKVDDFHTYKVYTGKKTRKIDRKTLNMPAKVAQRWADLLLNEKVEINVENQEIDKFIKNTLRYANFYVRGNNLIELAFAIGGGYLIEYFDGEQVNIKYISQEFMVPITYDTGKLIECAFASKKIIQQKEYYYIECHTRDENGFYKIANILVEIKGKQLVDAKEEIYELLDIDKVVETNSKHPTFQRIAPNVANKDNFNSAYGTSVYSGALDVFKTIDIVYDSYGKEFILGKKKIFIQDNISQVNWDEEGNPVKVFDPNDEVFYAIPKDEDNNNPPITESNMELRVPEHDQALQTNFNVLSEEVGFGNNGFKWENGSVTTATEVISENSDMYRTLKKHETQLRESLVAMVRGLLVINNKYLDEKLDTEVEVSINFDDSIIEDKAETQRISMLELDRGIISIIQYYQDVYKMTEEQAQKFFKKMQEQIKLQQPEAEEEPPVEES